MRILYDSKNEQFKTPFGTLAEGEDCKINIHIPASCKTAGVQLQLFGEAGGENTELSMSKNGGYDEYEIFSVTFSLKKPGLYFYRFFITTADGSFPLFKYGYDMTNMCEGGMWQVSCVPKSFSVPENFFGNVMYQIFPDRFFKSGECDTSEKLAPFTVHKNTNETPNFLPDENGEVLNNDFFGGNLKGIASKIRYLKRLGVSVIYLNPIFKAFSNHRYDTADYMKIDEMLGSESDFRALCKKAHRNKIKIVLDGVFSHTGSNSVYFDKQGIFGSGAYGHEDSPYRSWYDFSSYPGYYTSWWGIKTLPCVNENDESFRSFIFGGEDSVIAHWLRLGADGFRLDVADELPDSFIAALRKRIKQIKSDAILIGEVWEDASNKVSYGERRRYFVGGELDSVMNYPFRTAIIDFTLGKDGGEKIRETVMSICENYPRGVTNVLMNVLSTHDTPRILSVLSGAEFPEEKQQQADFRLDDRLLYLAQNRLECAAFMQFVLPGIPCIYYGDEIGTQGLGDPFCRLFFDWGRAKKSDLRQYYCKLCALKARQKVLRNGRTEVSVLSCGFLKITRKTESAELDAYINCSDSEKTISGGRILFANRSKREKNSIKLESFGCVLVKR